MSEYPQNEKNNTFTWLSSLYNLFEWLKIKSNFIKFIKCFTITKYKLKYILKHDQVYCIFFFSFFILKRKK